MGRNGNADVIVAQEQPPVAAGESATGVQKPGLGTGRIHVQELEQLFLEVPEPQEPVFGNAEAAQVNYRAEEGEVGVRVSGALKGREFEAAL